MKTVKFKKGKGPITLIGVGEVTDKNLTVELYDKYVKGNPNAEKYFEVSEEPKAKKNETDTEKK